MVNFQELVRRFYSHTVKVNSRVTHVFEPVEIVINSISYGDEDRYQEAMKKQRFMTLCQKAYEVTESIQDEVPVHVIFMPSQKRTFSDNYCKHEETYKTAIVTVGRELTYPVHEGYALINVPREPSFWEWLRKPFYQQLEHLVFRFLKWRGYFSPTK